MHEHRRRLFRRSDPVDHVRLGTARIAPALDHVRQGTHEVGTGDTDVVSERVERRNGIEATSLRRDPAAEDTDSTACCDCRQYSGGAARAFTATPTAAPTASSTILSTKATGSDADP